MRRFSALLSSCALAGLAFLPWSAEAASPDDLAHALSQVAPAANPQVLALATRALRCVQRSTPTHILSVIDYSRPSTVPRLWVFDVRQRHLLFREWVAHGRNSGANFARSFSNTPGSLKVQPGDVHHRKHLCRPQRLLSATERYRWCVQRQRRRSGHRDPWCGVCEPGAGAYRRPNRPKFRLSRRSAENRARAHRHPARPFGGVRLLPGSELVARIAPARRLRRRSGPPACDISRKYALTYPKLRLPRRSEWPQAAPTIRRALDQDQQSPPALAAHFIRPMRIPTGKGLSRWRGWRGIPGRARLAGARGFACCF